MLFFLFLSLFFPPKLAILLFLYESMWLTMSHADREAGSVSLNLKLVEFYSSLIQCSFFFFQILQKILICSFSIRPPKAETYYWSHTVLFCMKHSVLSNLNFRRGVSPLLFLVYNNEDNGVGLEKPYILWQTSSPCPEGRLPTMGFLLQLKSLGEWDTGMFFFCFLKASEDGRDSPSVCSLHL